MGYLLMFVIAVTLSSAVSAQDISPLRGLNVWQPMTYDGRGIDQVTDQQMQDARDAGYDTIMVKTNPSLTPDKKGVDFISTDRFIDRAISHGFKILPIAFAWNGLGADFWDVDENGKKTLAYLDPFWPEAMERLEWYYGQFIDHFKGNPRLAAFIVTWGIYGEAGFYPINAGRSPYALARFNEWRAQKGLPALDKLPTKQSGPNTDYNLFIRFRYLYVEEKMDAMVRRLKIRAGNHPVGIWQEMYPTILYVLTQVEVPSADFGLYEAGIVQETTHHPERAIAETMGLRYRCSDPQEYVRYMLPNVARRRGDGSRFMGNELGENYAVKYLGMTPEEAHKAQFDRYEDEFGPVLKKLLDTPLEAPKRDVLIVYPTYATSALNNEMSSCCDTIILERLLRSYGCQMARYGTPRFDKMTTADMNKFKLIIVPNSAYLLRSSYEKLKNTTARVLFTGEFGEAIDGEQVPMGGKRDFDGSDLEYIIRPGGEVSVVKNAPLTRGLTDLLKKQKIVLVDNESFRYGEKAGGAELLLRCGNDPLLSTRRKGKMIFIHGCPFAAACVNPQRKPPKEGHRSVDSSAYEIDMWGPYDCAHPQNVFGRKLVKNILDYAGVDYRVPDPKPLTRTPYLGDHYEQASISANIVYNNMGTPQTLTVRTPYAPKGYVSTKVGNRYQTTLTVPAYSYIALNFNSGRKDFHHSR